MGNGYMAKYAVDKMIEDGTLVRYSPAKMSAEQANESRRYKFETFTGTITLNLDNYDKPTAVSYGRTSNFHFAGWAKMADLFVLDRISAQTALLPTE